MPTTIASARWSWASLPAAQERRLIRRLMSRTTAVAPAPYRAVSAASRLRAPDRAFAVRSV
ncbi:MAG TPA: hypothetical protein VNC80_14785 [Mycobacteriales bacterium]|nr:hypothetical protein [Mycobacteriales bacterium]